ncbi:phosphate ABC transporter substrate-binding protein [Nitrospira sp.]|nr:phosphate ABC transporter substrate-binding protein [Nitrospira sp.]
MIAQYTWRTIGLVICGVTAMMSGAPSGFAASSMIKIDGSSTVYPVTEAVAEEFQKSTRGKVRVTVGISGTGGGFKKFCRGETDISDASRPILQEEIEACRANGIKYVELPVAFDALTIVVSPQNTWVNSITVADLKKMWTPEAQANVARWNQVRREWPDLPLALFGAGSDSGTFDYFTEAIVGKAKASRGDYTGSEDDNVLVQGVASNKSALGYIPFAYFAPHAKKLKALSIDNGQGPVAPSIDNVINGKYQPLSRPLFIYVKEAAAARPEVKAFVEFYLTEGAALAEEVKYIPLPKAAYTGALTRFREGRVGSAFGGTPEVGVSIEDVLKREPKL